MSKELVLAMLLAVGSGTTLALEQLAPPGPSIEAIVDGDVWTIVLWLVEFRP